MVKAGKNESNHSGALASSTFISGRRKTKHLNEEGPKSALSCVHSLASILRGRASPRTARSLPDTAAKEKSSPVEAHVDTRAPLREGAAGRRVEFIPRRALCSARRGDPLHGHRMIPRPTEALWSRVIEASRLRDRLLVSTTRRDTSPTNMRGPGVPCGLARSCRVRAEREIVGAWLSVRTVPLLTQLARNNGAVRHRGGRGYSGAGIRMGSSVSRIERDLRLRANFCAVRSNYLPRSCGLPRSNGSKPFRFVLASNS